MSEAIETPAAETAVNLPTNPFMMALGWIIGVCIVAGIGLLIAGFSLASQYSAQIFGTITNTGILQIAWGAGLLGMGIVAILVLLGAAAARWTPYVG